MFEVWPEHAGRHFFLQMVKSKNTVLSLDGSLFNFNCQPPITSRQPPAAYLPLSTLWKTTSH